MNKTGVIYGPVASRRLGTSLGIDLTPEFHCTMDCIYCEINVRKRKVIFSPKGGLPSSFLVLNELKRKIKELDKVSLDFVTVSGSGEPTLHPDLGIIAKGMKKIIKETGLRARTALITNSTLLFRESVLKNVLLFDVILGKLDAGSNAILKRINRPHSMITIEKIVTGLSNLTRKGGELWLTTMFVRGINDSRDEIERIASIVQRINPTVYLVDSPSRPPGRKISLSQKELKKIGNIMKELVSVPVRVVPRIPQVKRIKNIAGARLVHEILAITAIRPSTIKDLTMELGVEEEIIKNILHQLVAQKILIESDGYYLKNR